MEIFTENFIKNRIKNYFDNNQKNKNYLFIENKSRNIIDYKNFSFNNYKNKEIVYKLYEILLGRKPDKKGYINNINLLKKGYPPSSLIYLIGRSNESKKFRKKNNIVIKKFYLLKLKYYLYKIIEPLISIKIFKFFFNKLRFFYRYRKFYK